MTPGLPRSEEYVLVFPRRTVPRAHQSLPLSAFSPVARRDLPPSPKDTNLVAETSDISDGGEC